MVRVKKNYLTDLECYIFADLKKANSYDTYELVLYNQNLRKKGSLTNQKKKQILDAIDRINITDNSSFGLLKMQLLLYYDSLISK